MNAPRVALPQLDSNSWRTALTYWADVPEGASCGSHLNDGRVSDWTLSRMGSDPGTPCRVTEAEPVPLGESWGDYRLIAPIGRGGMGVVYRAEHIGTRRCVAVKVMRPGLAEFPDAVRQFAREGDALARLSHPHVAAQFDAGSVGGTRFLVLEHVPGPNLAELVRTHGPLSTGQAVHYILQAARGLAHAHSRGVVHLDVKPANLLLDARGGIKIVDFGLARLQDASSPGDRENVPGGFAGTADFASPEQAAGAGPVDARADLYGLGCTLFYLLTGKPPYPARGVGDKLLAHRRSPIPSLREAACDAVSPRLETVFRKMLAKRPEDRQASMCELIEDLVACCPRVGRSNSAPVSRPCRVRRHRTLHPRRCRRAGFHKQSRSQRLDTADPRCDGLRGETVRGHDRR